MFKSKKVAVLISTAALFIVLAQTAYAGNYTVASGDSLYTIGKLFNTTASTIKLDNHLMSSAIYPGQVLSVHSGTYTVQKGDSLYLIAKKYGVTLSSLRKANNLWSNSIYPGQKLNLPGQGSAGSQTSPGSTSSTAGTPGGALAYTQSDLDLLARLITAEAGSQPYQAQVAVGAVVVNRVKDTRFPNTLSGVIYQKSNGFYQFTPVENGWIDKPATQDAKNAAYEALHGVDPTHGALYYFDDSTTNKWLWSKPIAIRIDRMVFTYY